MKKVYYLLIFLSLSCTKSYEKTTVLYYDNGNKKIEGDFYRGERMGQWFSWYPTGEKKSYSYFVNGLQEGESILWFMNGQVMLKKEYKNGLENGELVGYFKNGDTSVFGYMSEGILVGKFKTYYKNGSIKNIRIYDTLGLPIGKWFEFDSLANTISKYEFIEGILTPNEILPSK